MGLTVGSLFSGIGGLDLGLERAGMEVIWQSEIDPYACKVLSKHWPEVVNHGNIKEINWQEVERPDVICGGYPCQPFSTAGKRRGEEDPRHLWPWVREAISQLRPRYAILENVRGHLSMGGLSVIAELASIGYDAEWRVVSAASVGANHRRDRIVIVAYPNNSRSHREEINSADTGLNAFSGLGRCCKNVANSNNSGNRTSGRNIDGNREAVEQGRQIVSQSWSCGCSSTLANTHCCESSDGGQCKALQSKGASRGNDRSGSGGDIGEISLGSTGQTSSDMADPNRGRCQQCEPEAQSLQGTSCSGERNMADPDSERLEKSRPEQQTTGTSRGDENTGEPVADTNNRRHVYTQKPWESDTWRRSPYSGFFNWETEPDVGRVAHGVPSRVDRLRGLGNAVVPQVAEVIGRLVISDYQRRED